MEPQLKSHQKTGETLARSCDPWIGNPACYPLYDYHSRNGGRGITE